MYGLLQCVLKVRACPMMDSLQWAHYCPDVNPAAKSVEHLKIREERKSSKKKKKTTTPQTPPKMSYRERRREQNQWETGKGSPWSDRRVGVPWCQSWRILQPVKAPHLTKHSLRLIQDRAPEWTQRAAAYGETTVEQSSFPDRTTAP